MISASFARFRLAIVMRLIQNRLARFVAQMCVNPRKSNVSGLPRPRLRRFEAACRPNSINRVLSGCSSSPNCANRREAREELPRVLLVLEPDDEVVGPPDDDHITVGVVARHHVDPQVQARSRVAPGSFTPRLPRNGT